MSRPPTQPPGWPLHHRSDRRTYTLGEPGWTACLAPDTELRSLLNAKASVGGGDRAGVSKVIAKKSASQAAAYGAHYLEQPHRRRHDSGLVGMLVNVPQSHGNKYGYATRGVILEQQRSRCLIRLDITNADSKSEFIDAIRKLNYQISRDDLPYVGKTKKKATSTSTNSDPQQP